MSDYGQRWFGHKAGGGSTWEDAVMASPFAGTVGPVANVGFWTPMGSTYAVNPQENDLLQSAIFDYYGNIGAAHPNPDNPIIPNSKCRSVALNAGTSVGTNGYYEGSAALSGIPNNYSLFAGVQTAASGGLGFGIAGWQDNFAGNGSRGGMLMTAGGLLAVGQDTASGGWNQVTGTVAINDGKPHLVGMSFDHAANLITGYQDGVSIGTVAPGAIPGDACTLIIARQTFGVADAANWHYWTGWLQSILYMGSTITNAQQSALFAGF